MSRTSAVQVSTHAVSPVSTVGAGGAAAGSAGASAAGAPGRGAAPSSWAIPTNGMARRTSTAARLNTLRITLCLPIDRTPSSKWLERVNEMHADRTLRVLQHTLVVL